MCLLARRVDFRFSRFSARRGTAIAPATASIRSRRKTVILTAFSGKTRGKFLPGSQELGGEERMVECAERGGLH